MPAAPSTGRPRVGRLAKIYSALLKTEDALLQSALDMNLPLPDMTKKLNTTLGDNKY